MSGRCHSYYGYNNHRCNNYHSNLEESYYADQYYKNLHNKYKNFIVSVSNLKNTSVHFLHSCCSTVNQDVLKISTNN